jgi:polyhydroxyalkanoate synthase
MLRLRRYEGKINMTTKDTVDTEISGENLEKLNENLRKVELLSKRLTEVMQNRTTHQKSLDGPDQALFTQAAGA